jgi:3-hydroxyisobutyrate dehydrogenase-like beta-hydroxyacid dehydrogenase
MRRVGVVGLGPMGAALATSLLRANHEVAVHDRARELEQPLVRDGAREAGSPRDVARLTDMVITFLPSPEAVREVALDPDNGVLAGLREGRSMLDMSTCGPDLAHHLGDAFERRGRRFLDCPVSRKAPDMTILVGGPQGCLDADADVLEPVSRTVIYCGRRGAGYATKLLNQFVKYSWYLASTEALLIAEQLHLDPAVVATAIQQSSGGESGLTAAAKYFLGDHAGIATHAPASTIEKDVNLTAQMAGQLGVDSPSLQALADFFAEVSVTSLRGRPYPESTELLRALRLRPHENGKNL